MTQTLLTWRRPPLPQPAAPLIGRERELADLARLILEECCRLVSLVGPGGIGKTRLALAVTSRAEDDLDDGVVWVPLQQVSGAGCILSAVGEALGIPQTGAEAADAQVLDALEGLHALLVLDNAEHLPDAPETVRDILARAERVQVLVTTRQAMNLQGEWRYELRGLAVPAAARDGAADADAVRLFAHRARQARSDFTLERDLASVIRICELVDGSPLALELAASWTSALDPAEIVAEITRNLDFLSTTQRDVPERHRSMHAVFEESWRLLDEYDRNAFARLSVFRGGFGRDAAAAVAGATLPMLSSLVDKSLLRRAADGRFEMHELLRQFAEARLAETPAAVEQARDAHARYYVGMLIARRDDLSGARQQAAADELDPERENMMAAWMWAVEHRWHEEIRAASNSVSLYYQVRGRYADGLSLSERAYRALATEAPDDELKLTLAHVLTPYAWMLIRHGRLDEARVAAGRAVLLCDELGVRSVDGFAASPLLPLGIIALVEGDYDEAERIGNEALERSLEARHTGSEELAWYILANVAQARGQYELAREHALRAYEITQRQGEQWFKAYTLVVLGTAASAVGDDGAAWQYFQASHDIRAALRDPEGVALALSNLGAIALRRGEHEEAARLYRQSVTTYREIGDRGGLAMALTGLGMTARSLGATGDAARHLREAIETAGRIRFVPRMLSILADTGDLLLSAGRFSAAVRLLEYVREHPASDGTTVTRAKELLKVPQARTSARGSSPEGPSDIDAVVAAATAELIALEERAPAKSAAMADAPLAGTLTEREREVLRYIADGLSNARIAEKMIVSTGTVKAHTHAIYRKLGTDNRVQAIARAREVGILPTLDA